MKPFKKDHRGLYLCQPNNHGNQTHLKEGMTNTEKMKVIHDTELALYVRKSADYGQSPVEKTGLIGLLIRITDKTERALNISENGKEASVKDENLVDTLMDISNYANMGIIELSI